MNKYVFPLLIRRRLSSLKTFLVKSYFELLSHALSAICVLKVILATRLTTFKNEVTRLFCWLFQIDFGGVKKIIKVIEVQLIHIFAVTVRKRFLNPSFLNMCHFKTIHRTAFLIFCCCFFIL